MCLFALALPRLLSQLLPACTITIPIRCLPAPLPSHIRVSTFLHPSSPNIVPTPHHHHHMTLPPHRHRLAPSLLTMPHIPSPQMSVLSPHCCPPSPLHYTCYQRSLSCTTGLTVIIHHPHCTVTVPLPPCTVTSSPPRSPVAAQRHYPPHFTTLNHQYPMASSSSTLTAP